MAELMVILSAIMREIKTKGNLKNILPYIEEGKYSEYESIRKYSEMLKSIEAEGFEEAMLGLIMENDQPVELALSDHLKSGEIKDDYEILIVCYACGKQLLSTLNPTM